MNKLNKDHPLPHNQSYILRLHHDTAVQCWQAVLIPTNGAVTIRFNGMEALFQYLLRQTETSGKREQGI